MKYRVSHTTKYAYSEQVSVCHNKLHLAPRVMPNQAVADFRLLVSPDPVAINKQIDYFENRVDYFSIQSPHQGLSVTATSQVDVRDFQREKVGNGESSPDWQSIHKLLRHSKTEPDGLEAYQFAFASRLIPTGEQFADYAKPSFADGRPIVAAALDLTRRVFEDFKYDPRATTVSTRVGEVFEKRAGVCQDFAHLQIACLRSLGLAARYVSGYLRTFPAPGKPRLVGADASHAWVSIYCGKEIGWVDFDPTNNVIPATNHITIGWGRDYSDLCPIQGVFVGGGQHTMEVRVDVQELS